MLKHHYVHGTISMLPDEVYLPWPAGDEFDATARCEVMEVMREAAGESLMPDISIVGPFSLHWCD